MERPQVSGKKVSGSKNQLSVLIRQGFSNIGCHPPPPPLKKRKGQFKRVFTSDLAREFRGRHVINLQMLSSGLSGVASVSLNVRK
jgi:hypothetical protein